MKKTTRRERKGEDEILLFCMHRKNTIHTYSNSSLYPSNLLSVEGRKTLSDVIANGVHYWFSNLPYVRENGEWALSSSSGSILCILNVSHELNVDASFFFFSFSFGRELSATCITLYKYEIYCICCADAFDVWRTNALRKFITSLWYQRMEKIYYIEIASHTKLLLLYGKALEGISCREILLCHATNNL